MYNYLKQDELQQCTEAHQDHHHPDLVCKVFCKTCFDVPFHLERLYASFEGSHLRLYLKVDLFFGLIITMIQEDVCMMAAARFPVAFSRLVKWRSAFLIGEALEGPEKLITCWTKIRDGIVSKNARKKNVKSRIIHSNKEKPGEVNSFVWFWVVLFLWETDIEKIGMFWSSVVSYEAPCGATGFRSMAKAKGLGLNLQTSSQIQFEASFFWNHIINTVWEFAFQERTVSWRRIGG